MPDAHLPKPRTFVLAIVVAAAAVLVLMKEVGEPRSSREPMAPLLSASVTPNLRGWSTAGVGEVLPHGVSVRTPIGDRAVRVRLTRHENRSELIFGGNGSGNTREVFEFHEGDEYWFGYSFDVKKMTYGRPGAHNLIMQFKSEGEGGPQFGLQLWDWRGHRGLWSHGGAMGGDRYLAPLRQDAWHVVKVHFKASATGRGAYQLYLDGKLIDSREHVSMIVPGDHAAYIKVGLYRNGETNPGTAELLIDSTKIGLSADSVRPG